MKKRFMPEIIALLALVVVVVIIFIVSLVKKDKPIWVNVNSWTPIVNYSWSSQWSSSPGFVER
jgi:hypothetical protein